MNSRRFGALLVREFAAKSAKHREAGCAPKGCWRPLCGWALALFIVCLPAADLLASQFVQLEYNLTLDDRSRNTVFIEVFDDKPLTQANFMSYVNAGKYDGTIMHRLSRNFVIQGGGFYPELITEPPPVNVALDPAAKVDLDGNLATPNPTVTNEYALAPVRSNSTGTIAMARIGGQPNSATNQWFVNLRNNPGLDTVDGGFTVFARVAGDGMVLYQAFNGLGITNLNPDTDDNGVRNEGPFGMSSSDGVPFLGNNLVVLTKAKRVDYLGAGLTTAVPSGGLAFTARDAFIEIGSAFTGAATDGLTIGAGRRLGIREGFSLNRSLQNYGTLAPGLQLGAVTVQGNYFQFPTGTLEVQLRGTTVDTEYDRLAVAQEAYLGGVLDVSLLSGFSPAPGNSFTVLTAGLIIGDFIGIDLPMLEPGLVWDVTKTLTTYTLSVASADYNRNGVVDAADYVVWKKNFFTNVTPYSSADGNGDGFINDGDLLVWWWNYGNVRGSSSGGSGAGSIGGSMAIAVPEPASLGGIALLAGILIGTNRSILGRNRRRKAS